MRTCGDGVITPAISVLSAVEGLEIITPAFKPYVIPISLVVLVFLFLLQRHGTASVGKLFGPVMMVWFATLALLGGSAFSMIQAYYEPWNPGWAASFLANNPLLGFFSLGAVVLALTGK